MASIGTLVIEVLLLVLIGEEREFPLFSFVIEWVSLLPYGDKERTAELLSLRTKEEFPRLSTAGTFLRSRLVN